MKKISCGAIALAVASLLTGCGSYETRVYEEQTADETVINSRPVITSSIKDDSVHSGSANETIEEKTVTEESTGGIIVK